MKLFYMPGTCALAVHIALAESRQPYLTEAVDMNTRLTAGGVELKRLNPKGKVPVLVTDSGATLTETTVLLSYIADNCQQLMPAAGTLDFWRVKEWLSYLSTEIHNQFDPLFVPPEVPAVAEAARATLGRKFAFVESMLEEGRYLVGDTVTVADLYLYVMLRWAMMVRLPLGPVLSAFHDAFSRRPATRRAVAEQGLPA